MQVFPRSPFFGNVENWLELVWLHCCPRVYNLWNIHRITFHKGQNVFLKHGPKISLSLLLFQIPVAPKRDSPESPKKLSPNNQRFPSPKNSSSSPRFNRQRSFVSSSSKGPSKIQNFTLNKIYNLDIFFPLLFRFLANKTFKIMSLYRLSQLVHTKINGSMHLHYTHT